MSNLKGENLLPSRANSFFSVRVDPFLEGALLQEGKQEVTKLFPL